MHVLPTNLAAIANIASENPRYQTAAVHVKLHDDNTFTVAATDCVRVIQVTGECLDRDDYPSIATMQGSPNGATEGLVPASSWKKFFTTAEKLTKKKSLPSKVKGVATIIGSNVVTLGATDLDSSPVDQIRLAEGNFAPVASAIRKEGSGRVRFKIDAKLFADTLNTMLSLSTANDKGQCPVMMEIHKDTVQIMQAAEKSKVTAAIRLMSDTVVIDYRDETKELERLRQRVVELEFIERNLIAEIEQMEAKQNRQIQQPNDEFVYCG